MIRRMTPQDQADYLSLAHAFYHSEAVLHPVPDRYHVLTFHEILADSPYLDGLMIEREGENAGYAILSKSYSPEAGGFVVWVEEIYIRPAHRGQGLARAFFAYLFETYGHWIKRFRLEVEPDNRRAIDYYASLGFQPLDYRQMVRDAPDDEGAGRHGLL